MDRSWQSFCHPHGRDAQAARIVVRSNGLPDILSRMNSTLLRIIAVLFAGLPIITSPSHAQATAKKETEAQTMMRSIAEKTIIDRLVFTDADITEVVSYLRKKSVECSPEKDPDKKGLNFVNRIGEGAKPITMDVRNISLWVAIHKVAAMAGAEVMNDGLRFTIHPKRNPPKETPATPAAAAFEKSAVWKTAAGITLDRIVFAEADVTQACVFLKAKSKEAHKEKKGVDISAEGKFAAAVTLDLRNIRLTDAITTIAEIGGAEITVSGDKIILKPAKKTE